MDSSQVEIDFHAVLAGAWGRMARCLFQPFDLRRWLWLGLCAWLAYLGEQGGGCSFSLPSGRDRSNTQVRSRPRDGGRAGGRLEVPAEAVPAPEDGQPSPSEETFNTIRMEGRTIHVEGGRSVSVINGKVFVDGMSVDLDAEENNDCVTEERTGPLRLPGQAVEMARRMLSGQSRMVAIIVVALVLILLVLALAMGLLLAWIKARFDFIFMDNLLNMREEISGPWRRFAKAGWSLFLWRLLVDAVYGLIFIVLLAICVGLPLLLAWPSFTAGELLPGGIVAIILGALLLLTVIIPAIAVYGIVGFLMRYFLVPIMIHRGGTMTDAWRVLLPLMRANRWAFLRFLLIYCGLSIAAGIAMLAILLGTCCLCGVALIPLLGGFVLAVATLPIAVFWRFLAIEFLAQFGRDFAMFPEPAEPIPAVDPRCHPSACVPGAGGSRAGHFTLVELLVVMAIIITLAGILLSALGRAEEKARQIQCAGHLKQIGIALHIYTVAPHNLLIVGQGETDEAKV